MRIAQFPKFLELGLFFKVEFGLAIPSYSQKSYFVKYSNQDLHNGTNFSLFLSGWTAPLLGLFMLNDLKSVREKQIFLANF